MEPFFDIFNKDSVQDDFHTKTIDALFLFVHVDVKYCRAKPEADS